MTKNRSKGLFIAFSIILVICLIACFVNFTYPLSLKGNYYSYSSFVDNLRLGEDVSSSLRVIYRAEQGENEFSANYDELRTSTMLDLEKIVKAEGYKDVTVSAYGDDGIVLEVGNLLTLEDRSIVEGLIGNPATISFSTDSEGKDPFAGAKHIKSVDSMQYNNPETGEVSYIVTVEFKKQYKSMIADASNGKTVYINLGENRFAELDYSEGSIADGIIYLQSSTFKTLSDAKTCANQIRSGMLDLSLTQLSSDMISPSYGHNAKLMLAISMVIVVVAILAFMVVRYRQIGLVAMFNLLFYIVLGLFFLQSIPLVNINFSGMVAMLICFVLAVDGLVSLLESAKEQYRGGAPLYIAFREAQKNNLFKTLFLHALIFVAGFTCVFMPVQSVQSFGWVALVLSLVSVFTNLAMMRLFTKMYLALNNEDGKKCNFHKGGKNA